MIRHYGLKIDDQVLYIGRKFVVVELDFMDNNRVYLKEIKRGSREVISAVAEHCKKI